MCDAFDVLKSDTRFLQRNRSGLRMKGLLKRIYFCMTKSGYHVGITTAFTLPTSKREVQSFSTRLVLTLVSLSLFPSGLGFLVLIAAVFHVGVVLILILILIRR